MISQETERRIVKEFVVVPEELSEWRLAVGTLREKPGLENRALYVANLLQESALELGEHEHAFHFILEQSLVWQHIAMEERDRVAGEMDEERMSDALSMMEEDAQQAEKYRQTYGLDDLKGDSLRFLGKVAEYRGKHVEALELYQESKRLLLAFPPDSDRRTRWIEVQGFEAASLITNGAAEEGLGLARETWERYEKTGFDLYTHKVWQSGVAIGAVRALLATGNIQILGREEAERWLNEVEVLLVVPEDLETWGDRNFAIRRREIKRLRKDLR